MEKINYINNLKRIIKSLEDNQSEDIERLEINMNPNETNLNVYWNDSLN